MTFTQFQQTRTFVHTKKYGGRLAYFGDTHIEFGDNGVFVLEIANWSSISADLTQLEHELYDWANSEGYFEPNSEGVYADKMWT